MKIFNKMFLFMLMILLTTIALAQDGTPVDPALTLSQLFNMVIDLVTNWKILSGWVITSSILVILIGILKSNLTDALFLWHTKGPIIRRAVVVVLGQVLGIILAISTGVTWYSAIIIGLFTSGGAVIIYNVLKPLWKKKV